MLERIDATHKDQQSTTEVVLLDSRHTVIGRLRFRLCGACHKGLILDVWVVDEWRGQGLGRELVHTLVVRHSGVQWSTTRQTRQGRPFFSAMAQETEIPFPQSKALCVHLEGRFTRAWRRLVHMGQVITMRSQDAFR